MGTNACTISWTPQKYYATADFSAFIDGCMTPNELRAAEGLPPLPLPPPRPAIDVYGIRSARDARRFEKEFNRKMREESPGRFVIIPNEQTALVVPRVVTRRYELAPVTPWGTWAIAAIVVLSALTWALEVVR